MLPALYYILYTITLKMSRLKYISCMILTKLYANKGTIFFVNIHTFNCCALLPHDESPDTVYFIINVQGVVRLLY